MPNETAQPLSEPKSRDPRDEQLVGQVLGPEAEAEMAELVGDNTATQQEPEKNRQLDLSADEIAATAEAEKPVEERRHEEYIAWAADFDEDEGWIDQNFDFFPDGTIALLGDLHIFSKSVEYLPKGMKVGKGKKFNARNNCLTTAEGIPEGLKELVLTRNKLTTCKGIPNTCYELLDLSNNPITDLSGLPDEVRTLDLRNIQAASMPTGLSISRLIVNKKQEDLIKDAELKGYNVAI